MTEPVALRYRAFLLGPGRYDDPDLPTPQSLNANLAAVRSFLVEGPFAVARPNDVVVCRDEPGLEMKSKLANWFASGAPDDVMIFYFTGHGQFEQWQGAVFPLPGISENQLAKLTPDDIRDFCRQARRSRVFVIIDACRANASQLDVSRDLDHVYWMLASYTSAADDSTDPSSPSPFTAALLAALSEVRNDTDSKVRNAIIGRGVSSAPVIRHASWELDEVPLRRVASTFPKRRTEVSTSSGGGWAAGLLALLILGGCVVWLNEEPDDPGLTVTSVATTTGPTPTPTPAVASAGPAASASSAPSTSVTPRADTMAEMDLGLARPIVTTVCDGRWIVQVAAVDADDAARAAEATGPYVDAGADYAYAPLGCGPLSNSGDRYVVFFGSYGTDTEARGACDAYKAAGGQECFVRRML